ncbi:ankyrin repeat domain-containing protein [Aspergillus undulatus]|uniref:ankyrin repeat domain-containing protein n=1 Tax=Aspergillus undulatus TaxID=1810928 RepID=UPI003CCDEFC8
MSKLFDLPVELLQLIVDHQESQSDINAFIRTCRYLYDTFNEYLYRYNLRYGERSAMFYAAQRDIAATAANSMGAGPYTELRNITRETPLMIAARRGHQRVLKHLISFADQGIELEARNEGVDLEAEDEEAKTPLILAALNYHHGTVKLLLEHGAAVDTKDLYGRTALTWAAEHGELDTVDLLLEKGSLVDSRTVNQSTPLILAASRGHDTVVKRLLEAGADPNASSISGWTVLHHAAFYYLKDSVISLLLEAGSDPRATISNEQPPGRTPAELALTAVRITGDKSVGYNILLEAAKNGYQGRASILG